MMMMKYHGVELQGKVHGIMNAPWPTLFCTTVQGKIPGTVHVGICVYDIRGDSHMYLTLLDKKGGLPVIFCSKRSKDDGRGGKFTKSRFTPPRPPAIVLI